MTGSVVGDERVRWRFDSTTRPKSELRDAKCGQERRGSVHKRGQHATKDYYSSRGRRDDDDDEGAEEKWVEQGRQSRFGS